MVEASIDVGDGDDSIEVEVENSWDEEELRESEVELPSRVNKGILQVERSLIKC